MNTDEFANLTPRQKRFCEEYLVDGNGTAAYKRSGYRNGSDRSAGVKASVLLNNPLVQRYIQKLTEEQSRRTLVSAEQVLTEVARVAFSNLKDIVEWGRDGIILKESTELPHEVTAAIAEITYQQTAKGSLMKIKLHDKMTALVALMKCFGCYGDLNQAIATFIKYGYQPRKLSDGSYVFIDKFGTRPDLVSKSNLELDGLVPESEEIDVEQAFYLNG